jgi:hypothetical protein
LEYFEGALADAPASARPDASSATASIANDVVMVAHLNIAASIRFETNPNGTGSCVLRFQLFSVAAVLVDSLSGVLLSLRSRMIPTCAKRKDLSCDALKISNSIRR